MTEQHPSNEELEQIGYSFSFEGIDRMEDEELAEVMALCEDEPPDPGNCWPCYASVVLATRIQNNENKFPEDLPLKDYPHPNVLGLLDQLRTAVISEMSSWQALPSGLSMEDLAVLAVAAEKWLSYLGLSQSMEIVSLSEEQTEIIARTTEVVKRVRSIQ